MLLLYLPFRVISFCYSELILVFNGSPESSFSNSCSPICAFICLSVVEVSKHRKKFVPNGTNCTTDKINKLLSDYILWTTQVRR